MFQIDFGNDGEIVCTGRLDAAQCEKAQAFMDGVGDTQILDFSALEYISSAGLGILLSAQKRLSQSGHSLKLTNLNSHLREIFRIAGFDRVFTIE